MAQGRGQVPWLGPNVKFFLKRFLYAIILIQLSLFQTVIFIFQISAINNFKKVERKMAQGLVPSPTHEIGKIMYQICTDGILITDITYSFDRLQSQ